MHDHVLQNMQQAIPHWTPPLPFPNTTTIRQLMRLSALPMSNMSTLENPALQSVTSLSDYQDILYWCRGSTQEYLSMNMLCSSDHPTHPLHSTGFISISYQFISGHLHYQRFSCPLIKMSNPILFDKWRKCKLGWTTHELWENCLSSKTLKLLHHANWYRVNLQMYVFKQYLIFISTPNQVWMNLQN